MEGVHSNKKWAAAAAAVHGDDRRRRGRAHSPCFPGLRPNALGGGGPGARALRAVPEAPARRFRG